MNARVKLTIVAGLAAVTSLLGCSAGISLNGGSSDPSTAQQPGSHAPAASRSAHASSPPPRRRSSPGRVGASAVRMASMPDVRGLTMAQASARLRSAGFTGTIKERDMSRGMCPVKGQYPAGQVCNSFPAVGRRQAATLTVTLTVAAHRAE